MKPLSLLVLLLLAAAGLRAQEQKWPRAEVDLELWNFGEKEQGDKDEKRIVIRNAGEAPLAIQFAKVTCGCLATRIETDLIAPGAEGAVVVILDAARQQGEIKKMVFIGTNDPKRPRIDFRVEGLVHARVRFEPPELDLGEVDPAQPVERTQELLVREGLDIELLGVDVGLPESLAVRFEAFGDKEGRHGYRLHFKPLAGLPRGQRIMVPLQFRFDDELVPRLGSAVAVQALGLVALSADLIDFGDIEVGGSRTVELVVRHREGRDFKLTSLRALDPAVTIKADLDRAAKEHRLELTRAGSGRPSAFTSRLYLVTDLEGQRMLTLPIQGRVVPKR